MRPPVEAVELEVGGRRVRLSRPDKPMYPAAGFTKRDVADYLVAVAPALLPHLAGRGVTLARFPDGVDAPGWYQVNCPPGQPEWLPEAPVPGSRGQVVRYCRLEEPAALVWAASTGGLELHPLLSRLGDPAPAALVLDLDAAPPAGLLECGRLALRLRARLGRLGLEAGPKTSGGRGLHLFAPLDGRASFGEVRAFARSLAAALAREDPAGTSDRLERAGRAGKVLVDWRQNDPHRSMIAPYSLRAATVPVVSTPLRWEELERALEAGGAEALRFGPAEVRSRLERHGDLFAPVLRRGPPLPRPEALDGGAGVSLP